MSITRVQGGASGSSGSVTSFTTTALTTGIVSGNLVLALIEATALNETITPPDASWTQAVLTPGVSGNGHTLALYYLVVDSGHAGQTSWTWTVSTAATIDVITVEWHASNGWPANPLDQTSQSATSSSTTTCSSGATPTTTQGEELWFAGIGYNNVPQTQSGLTSGWSSDLQVAGSSATVTLGDFYQIASATGSADCSFTIGTARYNVGVVATFMDNLVVGALTGTVSGTGTLSGILTVTSAPSGSGTTRDLSVFKDQQVVVFNSSGQFIGTWPDAPLLAGFKETLNSGTTPLTVELPRPFDSFDLAGSPGARGTIAQGNIVQFWLFGPGLPQGGKLRYQGVIDTYNPQIKESGEESVTVTLTPYSSVIADHGLIGTQEFGTVNQSQTYVDPVAMFNWFFQNSDPLTGVAYASPLTLASGNPSSSGRLAQYAFQAQSLQSIFETIKLMLPPNWFYRINPDKSVTLNSAPTTPQHILQVGQHVANPQFAQDWLLLKNVVYFVGASGSVQVGGQTLNQPVISTTVSGSDISVFGQRIQFQNDTRVTDQNTAKVLAQGILNLLDQYTVRTKIRVPDYRGDAFAGIGYDIESFAVGDTVQIVDYYGAPSSTASQSVWDTAQWDVNNWDSALMAALSPVVQIISLSYNFHYVDLELGSLQPNQDLAIFNIEQRFNDFTMV